MLQISELFHYIKKVVYVKKKLNCNTFLALEKKFKTKNGATLFMFREKGQQAIGTQLDRKLFSGFY